MDKKKRIKPEVKKNLSPEQKKALRNGNLGRSEKKAAPAPKHEPIITSEEDISRAKEISPFLTSGESGMRK